jgi:D-amino-acid oxidase
MNTKNVLVVGAGVSGLSTALELLNAGHEVTVWCREANCALPVTSRSAYAMWVPVKIDADPRVERWTDEGYSYFEKLAGVARTGVEMRAIWSLKLKQEEPWFAGKNVGGFRHAKPSELASGYADAHILERAPVIDPLLYLPWLREQFLDQGGTIKQCKVTSFDRIPAQFDVVVNCAGLGSRVLANDTTLFGERVQVVMIKPNGIDRVIIDDEGPNQRSCIVPHAGYVKLGAVFDGDKESLAVDRSLVPDILARCARIAPGYKFSANDVLGVVRAHRPERSLTRVEQEKLVDGRVIIHNYGHDGMGYILSHGIACEIVGYLNAC